MRWFLDRTAHRLLASALVLPTGGGYQQPGQWIASTPRQRHGLDLEREHRLGSWARRLVLVAMAAQLYSLVLVVQMHTAEPTGAGDAVATPPLLELTAVLVVWIAAGIVFMAWFHQAKLNAQNLGLPQRRGPAWAYLGFLIPIISFWFPYQDTIDLFPPLDPARSAVNRWWAAWIGASVISTLSSYVMGPDPSAGVVLLSITGLLTVIAAWQVQVVIRASIAAHRQPPDTTANRAAVPDRRRRRPSEAQWGTGWR
jgi:hypothetical protein